MGADNTSEMRCATATLVELAGHGPSVVFTSHRSLLMISQTMLGRRY